jgi:hypothetical protein
VGAVLGVLLILFLFAGLPLLGRVAMRRAWARPGFREWVRAYGPRLSFLDRDDPGDGPDG